MLRHYNWGQRGRGGVDKIVLQAASGSMAMSGSTLLTRCDSVWRKARGRRADFFTSEFPQPNFKTVDWIWIGSGYMV